MNLNRREFVEGSVAVAGVAISGGAFAVSSAEGVTKMKKVDLALLNYACSYPKKIDPVAAELAPTIGEIMRDWGLLSLPPYDRGLSLMKGDYKLKGEPI